MEIDFEEEKGCDWMISKDADDAVSVGGLTPINDENYYTNNEYLSNSMLGMMKEHPDNLRAYMSGEREENDAFAVGDIFHKSILEPHKIKDVVTWDSSMFPQPDKTLRTKENRDWLNRFKAANKAKGKTVLSKANYDQAIAMADRFKSIPELTSYLEGAKYELTAVKVIQGISCKSKGDIVHNDEWLSDLKSTSDASIESFRESCEKYGYYRQAAMYCHMFGKTKFRFILVEKGSLKTAVYEVSEENLKRGWEELMELIQMYKELFLDFDPLEGNPVDNFVMRGVL